MLKLMDVMGGPFVPMPAEQLFDEDGSVTVSMANVFGKADPALPHNQTPQENIMQRRADLLGGIPAGTSAQQVNTLMFSQPAEPVVTTETAGQVVPPWEAARREAATQETAEPVVVDTGIAALVEEQQANTQIVVPWAKDEPKPAVENVLAQALDIIAELPLQEQGIPEGWGTDNVVEKALEVQDQFLQEQDSTDWAIAKGRALPYSDKIEGRINPFEVAVMNGWVANGMQSVFLGHPITSFRLACRHAIAMTLMYYEEDVARFSTMQEAAQVESQSDECEAARVKWKILVDKRKRILGELDQEVSAARDVWHALRK